MTQQHSLTELLRQGDSQLRIFDMGRRVSKLSPDEFLKVELGQIPYPTPYLHHAWLALLMWNPKAKQQNVVWFLKLPLDERGMLVTAARDDLYQRLLMNAANLLSSEEGEDVQDALKDNPFSFKPDEEKMAIFHAYASNQMNQPASSHYEFAQQYFRGQMELEHWPALGYQGIADIVVRHQDESNSEALVSILAKLPNEPYEALCTALENITPSYQLFDALSSRLTDSLSEPATTSNHIAAQVRAISNSHNQENAQQLLLNILDTDHALEPEVIAAIATRCSHLLDDQDLMLAFLEKLAAGKTGQAGFSRILADLMFTPALRIQAMTVFRNPNRSEALANAIGQMFGGNH